MEMEQEQHEKNEHMKNEVIKVELAKSESGKSESIKNEPVSSSQMNQQKINRGPANCPVHSPAHGTQPNRNNYFPYTYIPAHIRERFSPKNLSWNSLVIIFSIIHLIYCILLIRETVIIFRDPIQAIDSLGNQNESAFENCYNRTRLRDESTDQSTNAPTNNNSTVSTNSTISTVSTNSNEIITIINGTKYIDVKYNSSYIYKYVREFREFYIGDIAYKVLFGYSYLLIAFCGVGLPSIIALYYCQVYLVGRILEMLFFLVFILSCDWSYITSIPSFIIISLLINEYEKANEYCPSLIMPLEF